MKKSHRKKDKGYTAKYRVEDVVNFFSGQLLQAKKKDGTQVFLQRIRKNGTLPEGYLTTLRMLRHPYLNPILDVVEEKDQIVLVHPPLMGDPLPLVLENEWLMEPTTALALASKLIRMRVMLDKYPWLCVSLDPKNILLDGDVPRTLFYSFNPGGSPMLYDQSWRELLFYLLTGEMPPDSKGEREQKLEQICVPAPIRQLAMMALDRKNALTDVSKQLDRFEQTSKRRRIWSDLGYKGRRYKRLLVSSFVLVAAISSLYAFWQSDSSHGDQVTHPTQTTNPHAPMKVEKKQEIQFLKSKNEYTYPYTVQGATRIQGSFELQQLNRFVGLLEQVNGTDAYGLQVDPTGGLALFQKVNGKLHHTGQSGAAFRLQPGKKYGFDLYYLPGEPLRVSIYEQGKTTCWLAVGTSPVEDQLRFRFSGGAGLTLYPLQFTPITNRKDAQNAWLDQQPWNIDLGQALVKQDEQGIRLKTINESRVSLTDIGTFRFQIVASKTPMTMEMMAADGTRCSVTWGAQKKLTIVTNVNGKKTVKQIPWHKGYKAGYPVDILVSSKFNKLSVMFVGKKWQQTVVSQFAQPITVQDVTLSSTKGIELIDFKE